MWEVSGIARSVDNRGRGASNNMKGEGILGGFTSEKVRKFRNLFVVLSLYDLSGRDCK